MKVSIPPSQIFISLEWYSLESSTELKKKREEAQKRAKAKEAAEAENAPTNQEEEEDSGSDRPLKEVIRKKKIAKGDFVSTQREPPSSKKGNTGEDDMDVDAFFQDTAKKVGVKRKRDQEEDEEEDGSSSDGNSQKKKKGGKKIENEDEDEDEDEDAEGEGEENDEGEEREKNGENPGSSAPTSQSIAYW